MRTTPVLVSLFLGIPALALGDAVVLRDTVENFVNVRMEPQGGSEVVGQLRHGERLALVDSVPRWHEVVFDDGRTGFISQTWTDVVPGAPDLASDEAESEPSDEPVLAESANEVREPETHEPEPAPEPAQVEAASSAVEPEIADEVLATEAGEADPATVLPMGPPEPDDELESPRPQVAEAPIELEASEPAAEAEPQQELTAELDADPANIEGTANFVTKFVGPTEAGNSQIFDDGRNVGIATSEPQEVLDVNGNIQINNRNSNLAVLMLTQAAGEMGYITHNLANTLTIGAGSEDRITIDGDGNVGIGVSAPRHPLQMASGASVTAGGVWTNASSAQYKENVAELTLDDALTALDELAPVQFNYKVDAEDRYVGFIAEEVPDLVASKDRQGLSAMDIVAVLTRVVQAQQQRIEELEARMEVGRAH